MAIVNSFADRLSHIMEWRHDFHTHPEIMFDTHRTAARVAELLRQFGCDDVTTGIGRTGVVGVIHGRSTASGRVIGLRADMDALPITEETGAPYASQTQGAMHACGHDGHTAMLLGAAQYLAETRNFDGTVVVIFQPAEEGGGGGREMCNDGLMDRWNIQEVYGMHNFPSLPVGQFAIRTGAFFASVDTFTLRVKGKGGHVALPHTCIDPVVVQAQLIMALQTITSRNADPVEQIALSITTIETSVRSFNVIPGEVELLGTVRTQSEALRDLAEQRLRDICAGVALATKAEIEVVYDRGYPCLVNPAEQTEFATEIAHKVSGGCGLAPLLMGGEDFAFMLQERPGAYILTGNGDTAACHNPAYDFNDEAIPHGCSWWVGIAEGRMPLGK